jgi:hypothetical protein
VRAGNACAFERNAYAWNMRGTCLGCHHSRVQNPVARITNAWGKYMVMALQLACVESERSPRLLSCSGVSEFPVFESQEAGIALTLANQIQPPTITLCKHS